MKIFSKASKAVGVSLAIGGLVGCGGGSDGVTNVGPDALIGVASLTGTDPQVQNLITISGEQDGEVLTLELDGYEFVASDGFDDGTAREDGTVTGTLFEIDLPIVTELTMFTGGYGPSSNLTIVYYGLVGPEAEEPVPTSGGATWNGSAIADIVRPGDDDELGVGSAFVEVTSTGTLSAEITGLSGVADTITLSDMTISGDRFTGSSVETALNGADVDVVGASAVAEVSGVFSGATVNDAPDEVGGLFTLTGDSGTLSGGFVAD